MASARTRPDQIDEKGAQLRVEVFCLRIEIIEAPAQLESDHRQARLFTDGRGLNQLVHDGSEAALGGLRGPVENNRCAEVAPGLRAWFGALLADLVERAVDLHLHDLKPGGKQSLRLLIGLERGLQQLRRGAPWS